MEWPSMVMDMKKYLNYSNKVLYIFANIRVVSFCKIKSFSNGLTIL